MLIVAAYESGSVPRSVLTAETFDNPKINWLAVASPCCR